MAMSVGRHLSRLFGLVAAFPFRFRSNDVLPPVAVSRTEWIDYLVANFNKEAMRVLEIGSRNVTGRNFRSRFSKAQYTGFDFHAGENVDVIGDVDRMSSYFAGQPRFDLIFSTAVFEHLYMPWVAAVENQRMLNVGGTVFVETHFSFSSHERPWHFFQYSDKGLRALFNDSLGFDLVDSGMSNPIAGYYRHDAVAYLRYFPVAELYCQSAILCRKRCEVADFDWSRVQMDQVVEGSRYPAPSSH
jgi:hypothetical protein